MSGRHFRHTPDCFVPRFRVSIPRPGFGQQSVRSQSLDDLGQAAARARRGPGATRPVQVDDEERCEVADVVIDNNGTSRKLKSAAGRLWDRIAEEGA